MKSRTAFAALDIGTSRLKLGVYLPWVSQKTEIVDAVENILFKESSGRVEMSYTIFTDQVENLFTRLGKVLSAHQAETLYLGICGHVSSLFPWDKDKGLPVSDRFPIWMDRSCADALRELPDLLADGKDLEMTGSFLPLGTHWLLTKMLHQKKTGFPSNQIWLQLGDALFYELCGEWRSHFSSQVSMVHQHHRKYVIRFMDHLGLTGEQLPALESAGPVPVKKRGKEKFGLPEQSFAWPSLGDYYASFKGVQLQDNEGFILVNTSEVAGVFTKEKPRLLENFVNVSIDTGFINYGSTYTGGNLIPWFFKHYVGEAVSPDRLNALTDSAGEIDPGETPVFLPYVQGERAPLWESRIRESFHEIRDDHSVTHRFRSVLEAVAFARRQCFEELKNPDIRQIKITGGSTQNPLWNSIRATVLGKKLWVSEEKDLAIVGTIRHMMDTLRWPLRKPMIQYAEVLPDIRYTETYERKYRRFLNYQKEQLENL